MRSSVDSRTKLPQMSLNELLDTRHEKLVLICSILPVISCKLMWRVIRAERGARDGRGAA